MNTANIRPRQSGSARPIALVLALVGLLAGGGLALRFGVLDDSPPPLPAITPVGGVELVYAQPFTLAQPATHWWRQEQPAYAAGMLLVLRAPVELLVPRQTAEPVLFVGGETAERVNVGDTSGLLVAIVPAGLDGKARVNLDLAQTPIYFGEPALPEQVDSARAAFQLAAARRAGIAPPSAAAVSAALQPPVDFDDDWQLRVHAADLVERYAPLERDVISGLRAPLVGR